MATAGETMIVLRKRCAQYKVSPTAMASIIRVPPETACCTWITAPTGVDLKRIRATAQREKNSIRCPPPCRCGRVRQFFADRADKSRFAEIAKHRRAVSLRWHVRPLARAGFSLPVLRKGRAVAATHIDRRGIVICCRRHVRPQDIAVAAGASAASVGDLTEILSLRGVGVIDVVIGSKIDLS